MRPQWHLICQETKLWTVGANTIIMKTTGYERTHFTVVLVCLADGGNLKPLIIFKQKAQPKDAIFHLVLLFKHTLKDGWMNKAHSSRCIMSGTKNLDQWSARDPCWYGTCLELTLLIVEKNTLLIVETTNLKTDLGVIPGGLTSMLQPLDVCLIKSFKIDFARCVLSGWVQV